MSLVIAAAQSASLPGDIAANLAHHLRFAVAAADHGVRLLVFPELSLTGYEPAIARAHAVRPDDPRLDPLKRLAQNAQMTVVVGAPLLHRERLHIAALALRPDGSTLAYTKQHVHSSEEQAFVSGTGGPLISVESALVALAICADTGHPEHAASAAARGANIYAAGVLITANGYEADAALFGRYAREHRMAVLIANHSAPNGGLTPAGRSAVWSEDGGLVVASPGTEEALIIATEQGGTWKGEVLVVSFRS
ncbi:MAG: carbon-nitrogen hydrolase family protein [Bryobacteraceae bacterium]|jgi:predicted amidohydrolase